MTTYTTPAHVRTAIIEAIGPIPAAATREATHAYLTRWADYCLEAAETALGMAIGRRIDGDFAAADQLTTESHDFLTEYQHIAAMRA